VLRVVEPFDIEAGLGERMRMPPLPTWNIENARAGGQRQHVYEPRDLMPVALLSEDRLVREEIVSVEIRLPPITRILC